MTLELNEVIEHYKEFEGRNTERMPELIAEGRVPLSIAGVMERRLNSGLSDWRNNYFDSDDAIVYGLDGKFKIVRGAQFLRELNPQSKLENGALVIENDKYQSIDAPEFFKNDKGLDFNREFTLAEVKAHPVWQAVVNDSALLTEYADKMFPEMKKRFGYDKAMGIYLASRPLVVNARALYVCGLEGKSLLCGGGDLDLGYGRLVGVAPEALRAPGKMIVKPSLETALDVVNEHLGADLILRIKN